MLGESPVMLDLADQVSRIAGLEKPVLIIGERGTGKELVAERIHFLSQRWDQVFLKVNCAAVSDTLLESDLFGHESGAFTSANKRRAGRFERAEGGSLFLDELATCSLAVQEKLLRVVEYGEYERLGGQEVLQADVRIVAATNADLPALAASEKFRPDLLDRLAFDVLHVPPLRERGEDVLLLAEHFAVSMSLELKRAYFPGFSEQAKEQMLSYRWPGNVRELRNVVERSLYRHTEEERPIEELVLDPFQPPWRPVEPPPLVGGSERPLKPANVKVDERDNVVSFTGRVERLEQQMLLDALAAQHYNQKLAAEKLGITYHQLRAQLRKHQMLPLKKYLDQLKRSFA